MRTAAVDLVDATAHKCLSDQDLGLLLPLHETFMAMLCQKLYHSGLTLKKLTKSSRVRAFLFCLLYGRRGGSLLGSTESCWRRVMGLVLAKLYSSWPSLSRQVTFIV